MRRPSAPAALSHSLSAVPHAHPAHFLKNRQFYRPESFIWNNPHRASQRTYQFYHSYNDHFATTQQPLIQQQEQQDREQAERARIERLIAFRSKARQEFMQKQRNRQFLEERTKNSSTPTPIMHSQLGQPDDQANSQTAIPVENRRGAHGLRHHHSERAIAVEAAINDPGQQLFGQSEDAHRRLRQIFGTRKQSNASVKVKSPTLKKKLRKSD